MTLLDLDRAQPQIRALARALGWERRQVVEALEAHASVPEAAHQPLQRQPAATPVGLLTRLTAAPKSRMKRNRQYREWVAGLPCAHCGIEGFSNACHGDEGKGERLKADDDTCWPGCVDRPGIIGCHTLFGATGKLGREERRRLERAYAAETQRLARESGHWPAGW